MNTNKRLFDCINHQIKNFAKPDMLAAKVNDTWQLYSTQQIKDQVDTLSAGFLHLGVSGNNMTVEEADKIAIISGNRPEWVITDLAVQQTGAILVPVYPTTNPLELQFILNDAAVKYIMVSDEDLLEKVKSIMPKVPSLLGVYTFDKIPGAKHWTEIAAMADAPSLADIDRLKETIAHTHIATIIYTSGTTGTPKGVMLSHQNIYANVVFSKDSFKFPDSPQSKVLSFLPLNHIFERMVTYIYLFSGIGIYYAERMETIGDNLKEIKPTGFTTVPRLLEKIFEKIMAKGNELTGVKRKLFYWAVRLGEKYDNCVDGGFSYKLQLALANKLVFNKWRQALGGNIEFIVTGGAACQVNLLRIFNAARIMVYEGYGPTENSPVISVNRRNPPSDTRFGSVGPILNHLEVKLAEDGEILVKGPTVMLGYYKRPDLTAEVLVDGWLHTGDIGTMVQNRFLKITDRKKELFKTSGGKYVAPQPIENKLKESPYVEQVMVVGAEKKFVGALIVPSFAMLREWMREKGLAFSTPAEAIAHPRVIAMYGDLVDSFNTYFNHVEQIKRFQLLPAEWSVESGEMTPKLSLKRKVIMEKYSEVLDRIYV